MGHVRPLRRRRGDVNSTKPLQQVRRQLELALIVPVPWGPVDKWCLDALCLLEVPPGLRLRPVESHEQIPDAEGLVPQKLKKLRVLRVAPEQSLVLALSLSEPRELHKREYLLKAGQVCRNIYFIRTGLVRCYYVKGEHEVCTWFMKEGDVVISIESFYTQSPGHEYIQALEATEVHYISFDQLQQLYTEYPEFNTIGRIVTQTYHQHWARQLYAIRMHTAEERYQWLLHHHPELIPRVPAKYLATYLDIAEVTFK